MPPQPSSRPSWWSWGMSEIWTTTQLVTVADITMGQSPDSSACNVDEVGLPFLQGCAEFGTRYPTPEIHCFPPLRIAKSDSILISVRAPVGQMNWSDQEYCIGRGLGSIKARAGIANTNFLRHALEQNIQFLHRRSQGSTFLAVGANDLKLFPIPDISETKQERIASILDTIDQAIEKTEALIHKYQQIKAGLMHDLFTRGLTADGKLRPPREQAPELYQETPIGWIPEVWDWGPLSKYLNGSPKNGYSPREIDVWDGCYALGLGCLTSCGFKALQLKSVPGSMAATSGALLEEGDFLVSRANTPQLVGLCGIYRNIGALCIYPDLMMRIRTNELIYDKFLEQYLLSDEVRIRLTALAVGTSSSMVKLNSKSLLNFRVAAPREEEQELIIRRSNEIFNFITKLEDNLAKLTQQKSGLMHDLLTGKVPVTIHPRGLDESATAEDFSVVQMEGSREVKQLKDKE